MSKDNYSFSSNIFVGPPAPFSYVAFSCARTIAKVGVFIFIATVVILSIVEFGPGIANFLANTYSEFLNFVGSGGYVWICFCLGLFAASVFFWGICVGNKLSWELPILPSICIGLVCIFCWLLCALAVSEVLGAFKVLSEPTPFTTAVFILIWLPGVCGFTMLLAQFIDIFTQPIFKV